MELVWADAHLECASVDLIFLTCDYMKYDRFTLSDMSAGMPGMLVCRKIAAYHTYEMHTLHTLIYRVYKCEFADVFYLGGRDIQCTLFILIIVFNLDIVEPKAPKGTAKA